MQEEIRPDFQQRLLLLKTLTDENNTPVSTNTTFEINLLKELEDQNLIIK